MVNTTENNTYTADLIRQPDECVDCALELTPGHNGFELFTEGDELYRSMLDAIAAAQWSIDMESYIFADDEIGWQFGEALAERARAGIKVRLLLDAAGSLFWTSPRLKDYFKCMGVKVRWFHRWDWRQPWRYNQRNHRKLLVIDNELAYLGGFNIHRENSKKLYGVKRWRDTHIVMHDSLAREAGLLFDAFWNGDRAWLPDSVSRSSILVHNFTRACRHRLRCIYADAFTSARRRIILTTPYFVPDSHTRQSLRCAARRGVDVCLIVPDKSDVRIARWAAHYAYAGLLAEGVRIFEYLPRMLHAKTVVIDGCWVMLGTANLDYRSLFINYELNLVTRDANLALALEQQGLLDMEESEQIQDSRWKTRGYPVRVLEALSWIARRWL